MELKNLKKYLKVQDIIENCKRENGYYLVPAEMLEVKIIRGSWQGTQDITKVIKNNPGKIIITKTIGDVVYYKIKD